MPNEETGSRTAFVGGDRMCYFLTTHIVNLGKNA